MVAIYCYLLYNSDMALPKTAGGWPSLQMGVSCPRKGGMRMFSYMEFFTFGLLIVGFLDLVIKFISFVRSLQKRTNRPN